MFLAKKSDDNVKEKGEALYCGMGWLRPPPFSAISVNLCIFVRPSNVFVQVSLLVKENTHYE